MERTVKTPDERRSELIATAQKLFYTKGYESTSVSDIVKAVGVAQGTFYYYFDSKAAVLQAIVDAAVDQIIAKQQEIIADGSLTAIPKWQKVVHLSNSWKIERKEEMIEMGRLMQKDENILLRHKLKTGYGKTIAATMAKIIAQGVDEGVFDVQHIPQTAEIMMSIISTFSDAINELIFNPAPYGDPTTSALQMSAAVQTAVERLLGAPAGSMPIIDDESLIAWFAD